MAVEMASRGHGRAMILLAPFTSIPAVVHRFTRVLPTSLLVGDRYDSLSKAGRVKIPTVIVHGTDDELVPYAMGVALSRSSEVRIWGWRSLRWRVTASPGVTGPSRSPGNPRS